MFYHCLLEFLKWLCRHYLEQVANISSFLLVFIHFILVHSLHISLFTLSPQRVFKDLLFPYSSHFSLINLTHSYTFIIIILLFLFIYYSFSIILQTQKAFNIFLFLITSTFPIYLYIFKPSYCHP